MKKLKISLIPCILGIIMIIIGLCYPYFIDRKSFTTYMVGDMVEFAGSNWYVIRDSSSREDYVVLLKKEVLTSNELGDYSYNSHDTMSYYYDDKCHPDGYGYDTWLESKCENSYNKSKVKEFLEKKYLNTLGASNLKKVKGYKIRLITEDELLKNLGFEENVGARQDEIKASSTTPTWVYIGYGEKENEVKGYWTMTSYLSAFAFCVHGQGNLGAGIVESGSIGVRPVINLLKTSIAKN